MVAPRVLCANHTRTHSFGQSPTPFFGFQLLLSLAERRGETTVAATSVWLDNMSYWLSKGFAMGYDLPALFRSSHSEELTCGGGLLTMYVRPEKISPGLKGGHHETQGHVDEH